MLNIYLNTFLYDIFLYMLLIFFFCMAWTIIFVIIKLIFFNKEVIEPTITNGDKVNSEEPKLDSKTGEPKCKFCMKYKENKNLFRACIFVCENKEVLCLQGFLACISSANMWSGYYAIGSLIDWEQFFKGIFGGSASGQNQNKGF